jgi:hypothetical protein
VQVGVKFELEIGLSETPAADVVTTGPIVVRAPAGETKVNVEVQVIADGFAAPQGWRHMLALSVAEPTKSRIKVDLVPLPQTDPVRLSELSVHFIIGGVNRGAASRNVVVETIAGTAPPPDNRGTSWLDDEAGQSRPIITLDSTPFIPDIELDIVKADGSVVRGNYRCAIRNAHHVPVPQEPPTIDLGDDAKTFAKTLIDEVSLNSRDSLVANLLDGVAARIAGKLPQEFWDVLQGVAAQVKDRPVTLQLNSSEPFVPWELAAVDPLIDPSRPEFLGAQVVMGRWILGDRSITLPPRPARSIRTMAVMAGMYKATTGLRALPEAILEAQTLIDSYAAMPAIPLDCTPADFQKLLDAAINFKFTQIGGVECVHFAGHGEVDPSRPGDAAIYLSDGRQISSTFFRKCNLGKVYAPFIFFNACMIGTAGQLLGEYGGFPGDCLAGGFCGLVAPLWAVNDSVARAVAIEFYGKALSAGGGTSIAQIVRDIRSKYDRKSPIASYLAYVYYGNPNFTLDTSHKG